jgi:hypothetical protein
MEADFGFPDSSSAKISQSHVGYSDLSPDAGARGRQSHGRRSSVLNGASTWITWRTDRIESVGTFAQAGPSRR